MNARRPAVRSEAKRCSIASDKVVADADAITFWTLGLDDGATETSVLSAVAEVDDVAGMHDVAHRVTDDTHEWPREHLRNRVDRVDDAELERVEDDERADGVDAGEVDE